MNDERELRTSHWESWVIPSDAADDVIRLNESLEVSTRMGEEAGMEIAETHFVPMSFGLMVLIRWTE